VVAVSLVLPFCPLKKTSCDAMPLALGQLVWVKIVEETIPQGKNHVSTIL
jgi:hypothetical protein